MLDLLLPRRCGACALPGRALCEACRDALVRLAPPVCERCGSPGSWPVARCVECAGRRLGFATARAALLYEGRTRLLIGVWKEHGRRDLSQLFAELVAEVLPPPSGDGLTFVPGERDRVLRRGHAPPERLAWELGRVWSLPVEPLLLRTRHLPPQRGLPLAARRRNVRGAFVAFRRAPSHVVLVDDVYTSGATASSCASALRHAGADRVDVVCLARAVR